MQRVAQAVFQAVSSEFESHHRYQIFMGMWASWSGRGTVYAEIVGSSPIIPAKTESVTQGHRVPVSYTGSCGFKSHPIHQFFFSIALAVECDNASERCSPQLP